jgi:autotransporter-associated beta strand protein
MMENRTISEFRVLCIIAVFVAGASFVIRNAAADSFDWRSINGQNWNSTVKNQFGGTCWDFSACGTLEAKYKLTRNDSAFDTDVSEQQVCWEGYMGGTNGGSGVGSVLNYFTSHGVVSEAECPHQPSSENVGIAPYWPLASGWENRIWKSVSNKLVFTDNINEMKRYLKTQGPLQVGIDSNDLYNHPADIKTNYHTPKVGTNHEVVMVGYYDDPTMPTGGYWVIKNSWDTGYGENGYGYMPYGSIEISGSIAAITGAVYYTGAMASASWKGGSGAWSNGGNNWTNNAGGAAYAWENKETAATFGGTGGSVSMSGSVIAHGLAIDSAGYSFSGGSLTVTAGGIVANEDVTFNSPVFIGGPQTWNAGAGKNLIVNGPVHTVISDLTVSGAGNTIISGAIDGGGVANIYGGAKPGGLIQAGTGTLTLAGISNFGGDITINSGAGALNIAPTNGGSPTYSGAFFGGGSIVVNSPGTVSIGGGASNFSGTISLQGGATLAFIPASGIAATFGGVIGGNGSVAHNAEGTTFLSGANSYTGFTMIGSGALQADIGVGIPSSSLIVLNGGVYQSNSANSFTLNLGTSGNAFQWAAGGGGFAAGTSALTVNIGGNATPNTLVWGTAPDDVGSNIVGPLRFGSTTSVKPVTFANPLDLSGADRTIHVNDNSSSTGDYAVLSGSISGSGGIVKAGNGLLKLTDTNDYSGTTTIGGGQLQATFGVGIPIANFLRLDGGVLQFEGDASFTRGLGTAGQTFQWTDNGGGFSAGSSPLTVNVCNDGRTLTWGNADGGQLAGPLKLNAVTAANSLTFVNGIDLNGGARTISVDANSVYFTGALADSVGGASLTKTGNGALYLQGSTGNSYTGSTTILGGNLYLAKTSGYAIAGDLYLGGTAYSSVILQGDNQIAPTSKIVWNGVSGTQNLILNRHDITVAGLSDYFGRGLIDGYTGWGQVPPTLTINNSTDCIYTGFMTGSTSLVKTGSGTQTLFGNRISYAGDTTISQGKLVLQDVSLGGNITSNAVLEFNDSISYAMFGGTISGSGTIAKTGGGKLTIYGSAESTFTGSFSVLNGTVVLAKYSGYALSGNLTITDGNSFVIVQNPNPFPASTVLTMSGSGDPHLEVYGNTVTVGGLVGSGTGGAVENTEGETGIGNGTLIVNNAATCTYGGALRNNAGGSGTLALIKDGTGTLTLKNSRSGDFTGSLTVKNGTLDYSNGSLPNCSYAISGGMLNIGTRSKTIPAFQITGGAVSGTGMLTSSTAYDVQAGSIDARLGGTSALNKTGPGTATLGNTNFYSGGTTVAAGTLVASAANSLGAAGKPITIQSGAELQLNATLSLYSNALLTNNGTITGTVSLGSGAKAIGSGAYGTVNVLATGVFSPGNGVGSATSGTTAWSTGGKYLFEIDDALGTAGSSWDLWNMDILSITASTPFTIAVASLNSAGSAGTIDEFDPTAPYSWVLASTTGTISGFSATAVKLDTTQFRNDLTQGTLSLRESEDAKQIFLEYTPNAVPEPGTLALLFLAAALGAMQRFRKRAAGNLHPLRRVR